MDIQNIQERVQFMLDKNPKITWEISLDLTPTPEDLEDEFLYDTKWYPLIHWYNTSTDISIIVAFKEQLEISISVDDWEYTTGELDVERGVLDCVRQLNDCYSWHPDLNISL